MAKEKHSGAMMGDGNAWSGAAKEKQTIIWEGGNSIFNMWTVTPPTSHLRKLCRDLGPDYTITEIDLEPVIYRDFGNDYDVEISGANTNKDVSIFLWKKKKIHIATVRGVPQSKIHSCVEDLKKLCNFIDQIESELSTLHLWNVSIECRKF